VERVLGMVDVTNENTLAGVNVPAIPQG